MAKMCLFEANEVSKNAAYNHFSQRFINQKKSPLDTSAGIYLFNYQRYNITPTLADSSSPADLQFLPVRL